MWEKLLLFLSLSLSCIPLFLLHASILNPLFTRTVLSSMWRYPFLPCRRTEGLEGIKWPCNCSIWNCAPRPERTLWFGAPPISVGLKPGSHISPTLNFKGEKNHFLFFYNLLIVHLLLVQISTSFDKICNITTGYIRAKRNMSFQTTN